MLRLKTESQTKTMCEVEDLSRSDEGAAVAPSDLTRLKRWRSLIDDSHRDMIARTHKTSTTPRGYKADGSHVRHPFAGDRPVRKLDVSDAPHSA